MTREAEGLSHDSSRRLRADFSAAAASYDAAAVLARATGQRMAERLDYVKIAPQRIADIGCATGDGLRELQRRYAAALPLALDYAAPMLREVARRAPRWQRLTRRAPRCVAADVRALPLASNSLDLVWSNLMLHWLDDPLTALREIQRVLAPGGLLMLATLGPDTLQEMRAACAKVGAGETVRHFPDMHDIGDLLLAAGFADPVMDREMLTLSYARRSVFLADQRRLGVRDSLLGRQDWHTWRQAFRAWPHDAAGKWPMSYEVVYGHAWKPAARSDNAGDEWAAIKIYPRKRA
ncbi:MAG TPA: methyltransferase domain-containing protein [Rhodocyclaceae bacterium]|nr:methyltransferase domain-containing protein [Rhodocyclaceae bacterium]